MAKIDKRRRQMLKIGGAGMLGGSLAGCLGGGGGGSSDAGAGTSTEADPFNVGMVYATGGLGDNSFNDMAHKGVKNAKSEFGVKYTNAEPSSPSDVSTLQRKFARSKDPSYELVCCIGFVQASGLKKNAKQFSDQKFTVVDAEVDQPNVASYRFKEHQGSFQVGHLAGLLTSQDFSAGAGETNGDLTVGFVGGKEIPLIKKFEAGYKAGVKHANADIDVRSAYAGAWNDPAKGKSIALSMYDKGADIVYHAAGGTGTGVFKAAQQEGRFALGVDADQSKSLPKYDDVILASMVKHVEEAVFRSIKNVTEDSFRGGEVKHLGLKEGGVEAVYGQKLGSEIPKDVKSKLEQSQKKVVDGEISVPKKPGNV